MKALLTPAFLLIKIFSPVTRSADFQKGLNAAQNRDFSTVLKEWTPLAEQGDADAQYNLALM